ncbi:hypothetical protein LINGRAHAP2_LOCUS18482 [Linum grandiflorum]
MIHTNNKKKKKNKSLHHHRHPPIPCKLNTPFSSSNFSTPPILHNGAFYSLGTAGRLGIFNPNKKIKWRVLNTAHTSFPADFLCETYLTKSTNGQLISVIVGARGESNSIKVLKFNEILERWDNLIHFKDEVIFLSRPSCMVINCKELGVKGLENTIHFSRFSDHRQHIFYSMSSKKFHTFEDAPRDDLCDTKLPINCAWIGPHDLESFNDQQLKEKKQLRWTSSLAEAIRIEDEGNYCTLEKLTFLRSTNKDSACGKMIIRGQDTSSLSIGKPWIIFPYQLQDRQVSNAYVDLTSGIEYYHSSETTSIDRRVFLLSDERLRGYEIVGSKNGRVFLMDEAQGVCALVDTLSMNIHQFPMWNNVLDFSSKCCVLHNLAPDRDSKISVIIFGNIAHSDSNFIVFWTVGDDRWTIQKGNFHMLSVVSHEGKIYGMTHDFYPEFMEIEIQPNNITPNKLFELPPGYQTTGCKTIRKFVESCGELLDFTINFYGLNDGEDLIADIQVYKIDVKKEESAERIKELDNFGDRAFFFSHDLDCGFGCCASESGLKANTIYYICTSSNKLYKYDYGDGSVSFSVYCRDIKEALYKNKFIMYC